MLERNKPNKKRKAIATSVKRRITKQYSGLCALNGIIKDHNYIHRIEGHHIIYRSQNGPDSDWNLIPLCRTCHSMVHKNKAFWQPRLFVIKSGRNWFTQIPKIEEYSLLPELMKPSWYWIALRLSDAEVLDTGKNVANIKPL